MKKFPNFFFLKKKGNSFFVLPETFTSFWFIDLDNSKYLAFSSSQDFLKKTDLPDFVLNSHSQRNTDLTLIFQN